ncbi:MAG: hypothetical protein ER33_08325 [Cyanobium sp. CACIAM 14]|nr:MAG: hypothetical protein ER33_08325 [Cyanobium sp. CACIAM 14]
MFPSRAPNQRRLGLLTAGLIGLFLLDLALTRSFQSAPLCPYYWIPVVLAASFASPRQVGWLTGLAVLLATLRSLLAPHATALHLILELVGLSGVAWAAIHMARKLRTRERSNRELQEHYRLLAENAPDVVIQIMQGTIRWISPSLTRMLGWRPEDWIGHPLSRFIPSEQHPLLERDLRVLENGHSLVTRLQALAHDHSRRWVELHASPYRDPQGGLDGIVGSFRTVDQEVAAEQELSRRARTDELTGLVNRREALDRITTIATRILRKGEATAVLFCDLDNFKAINDTFGHLPGDELLRTVATRIRDSIRGGDMAARIGGDELLVVLQGVRDLRDAVTIAEKLRHIVAEPIATSAGPLSITLSIGVTMLMPGEHSDVTISRADQAMYRAKQSGRNQVVTITPESDRTGERVSPRQPGP